MKIGKYSGLIFLIVAITIICVLTASCGTPAAGEAAEQASTPEREESGITEEELEQLEEAIAEEEADTTDYSSVSVGAEMYGYMPSFLCTDADNYVKIEVTNTSDFTWRAEGENKVRVGYHYYGQDVDFVEYDKTARSSLPENLEPGESATIEVLINDIQNPGTYVVQIDLVLEGHYWFSSKDVPMIEGRVFFSPCLDGQ